jgi:hypothetical protein
MMALAGQRNEIPSLADIHAKDKENLPFYGNE